MPQNLKACIIQIRDNGGAVKGTGFIIAADTAVTCAHVIEAADATPGQAVTIAFTLTGTTCPAEVLADAWRSIEDDDIAILRLQGELPAGVTPAILGPSDNTAGHPFWAFGYPEVGDMQGIWAEGKILGSITESQSITMLQLDSQQVTQGMSGGPVLDTNSDRVVGMIIATYYPDNTLKFRDASFARPIEAIVKVWPMLEMVPPGPSLTTDQRKIFAEGSHVEGSVDTGGGDFIGRDKYFYKDAVQVERDVIKSIIVTGDKNQFFIDNYERLREAYIEPSPIFKRVNLSHFVGREWLLAEVDAFLHNHDRGYFILQADAGLGKTTFLAWLVQERGYIHHFAELAPGLDGIGPSLKNLAAQLVLAYRLSPYEVEGVLPGVATRPDYLFNLLKQAADQSRAREKIVLVVDALDEAGTPPGQNVLNLPIVLPEGVYFIVSQRPMQRALYVDTVTTPRFLLPLKAEGDENQADMRRFLEQAATWPGVTRALQASGYSAEQFITTLLEKCCGVWIYLHFVIHEIERGERRPLDLDTLPEGMTQYYARHWQRWRDRNEERWDKIYLPLLTTLAATQEAITAERLAEWANINISVQMLRRLLNEQWRPFLAILGQGQQTRYRFYHATLREFFDGQVDWEKLIINETAFVEELTIATRKAHGNLAERYLKYWGGLEAGLPSLREAIQRDIDDGYGLRHLTAHLEAAGRTTDLHRLLGIEWVHMEERSAIHQTLGNWLGRLFGQRRGVRQYQQHDNVWYTTREQVGQIDGYLTDVTRAWRLAEEEFKIHNSSFSIGLQCRYALIIASLNSLAKNFPSELLIALVEEGTWSPVQGLTYTRQMPDPKQRTEALAGLVPFLPESLKRTVFREGLTTVRTIEDERDQAKLFMHLIAYAPDPLKDEVLRERLAEVLAIRDENHRAEALAELASYLPEELLMPVRTVARDRAKALAEQSPWLTAQEEELIDVLKLEQEKSPILARIMEQVIWGDYARAELLLGLAFHLPEWLKDRVTGYALLVAVYTIERQDQVNTLAGPILPLVEPLVKAIMQAWEAEGEKYLAAALMVERVFCGDYNKVVSLAELIPFLPESLQRAALRYALVAAWETEKERIVPWDDILMRTAPRLAKIGYYQLAVAVARGIWSKHNQAKALAKLAYYLPEPLRKEILLDALAMVRMIRIQDEYVQEEALAGLAPHMPDELLAEALTAAWNWPIALAALTLRLAEFRHPIEALVVARRIGDEWLRMETLIKLVPHLIELGDLRKAWATVLAELIPVLRLLLQDALKALALFLPLHTLFFRVIGNHVDALEKLAHKLVELGYLREALATAQGIWDKNDQAKVLIELTLQLAKLDYSEEALRTAQTIVDIDSRVKALTELGYPIEALTVAWTKDWPPARARTLVRLVPPLAELGAQQEVLRAVREIITYADDWAEVLVGVIPCLAEPLKGQVINEAVTGTQEINDTYKRAMVLALLAPYLPELLLQEALAAREFEDELNRAILLAGLSPKLEQQGYPQKVLAAVRALWYTDDWAKAMIELGYPQEVLAAVHEFLDVSKRVKALAGLAPYLPEPLKGHALQEALVAAQTIQNKNDQARVLAELAPRLAELGYLPQALDAVEEIEDAHYRAEALMQLRSELLKLPCQIQHSFWCKTLHVLARRTRSDLLSDIRALEPVLAALGGEEAVGETFHAIQDVCRWWT